MSTLTLPMASPKLLKRSFDDADLGSSQSNFKTPQQIYEQPGTIQKTEMSGDQRGDAAPSVDSSRLSSPAPSHASSSAVRDATMQAPQNAIASGPTTKRPKLTFAEKEAKRIEKEFKDREKAEEKARKEQEKENKDRQKAEEKAKKEEERRAKGLEKEVRRLAQEEKNKTKEEEKRKKDEEKAKKDEEKNKKAKVEIHMYRRLWHALADLLQSQLRLNAFFAPPPGPNDGSQDSPTRGGPSPASSRRSSITSLNGPGAVSRERSPFSTPQKASLPDYEKLFPPFFVKSHTILAPCNRFSRDEGWLEHAKAKLDEALVPQNPSSHAVATSALLVEFKPNLLETYRRKRRPQRRAHLSVKEIVARINGTACNPNDLTNSDCQRAVQKPIDMLKAIPTKFLKFTEDVRPPYIGTYTKLPEGRSSGKLGRNPFSRALPLTDYNYDSEAEWEEPGEGEDLESEGEEELEDDDVEDMEGFLDDGEADEIKKRRPIIGDLEPTCTGLCWEGSQTGSHRIVDTEHSLDLEPFRLDIILGK